MKIAIISDIHSNLEALKRVFASIDERQAEAVYCLGDIVGYGSYPNECIELVREKCSIVLQGNHDAGACDGGCRWSTSTNSAGWRCDGRRRRSRART